MEDYQLKIEDMNGICDKCYIYNDTKAFLVVKQDGKRLCSRCCTHCPACNTIKENSEFFNGGKTNRFEDHLYTSIWRLGLGPKRALPITCAEPICLSCFPRCVERLTIQFDWGINKIVQEYTRKKHKLYDVATKKLMGP